MKFQQIYLKLSFLIFAASFYCQNLNTHLQNYIKDGSISKAKNSILAIDLNTGDTLIAHRPTMSLVTASTTKIFSTLMALDLLGADYRFSTEVFSNGIIKNGVLYGDLWIRGGGDVSFGSHYFYEDGKENKSFIDLVDSIKGHGINSVTGNVYFDGSAFGYEGTPKGWTSSDIGNYYGAFPDGFNYYDNLTHYYFSTGDVGTKATLVATYPHQHKLRLNNGLVSANISAEASAVKGKAYDEVRTVSGKLPSKKTKIKITTTVADPEDNFANAFSEICRDKSLSLNKGCVPMRISKLISPDYDSLIKLFRYEGKPVGEIVNFTNKKSVNFFAEGLLNGTAYKLTGDGSNLMGTRVLKQYLSTKIDTSGLILVDGSGLSRNNRISAAHLCGILNYTYKSSVFSSFYNSLPVAGVSGTLTKLCVGQAGENRVIAKSGTMNGVKSYAGYINSKSGRKIVFTIITSGFSCSTNHVVAQMQKLLNALASL